ncbi:MAG: hypothetical protein OYL97_13475 [Candidatus Poribacteria bacterium]|nr:hypothetical protein [Candidatus Poribacteria bacterium]MDD9974998.1 hypothetical protein [Candidatus Poribacteria bacterium]MDE0468058.1 hypothetical protein [Candidatus Poribacteria bacterium]
MNDAEFRERVLTWMERTDTWMERTDTWMERTEEWKNKTDEQFTDIRASLSELQIGLGWIRGKLEGRQESDASLWGKIAVLTAVGSAIIALLAYFK